MFRRFFIFLVIIVLVAPKGGAARVVFTTEDNGIHDQVFYIDSGDTADDFIDLEFGQTIDAKLRYDVVNNKFVLNRDLEIAQEIIDSDGNTGANGQTLISDGAGKNLWQAVTASTVPYISTIAVQDIPASSTQTITYNGTNFLPTSVVTLPGFDGALNLTTIVSPTEFQIDLTAGVTETLYDVVVSNSGVLNTQWTGNGVSLLRIVSPNDGITQAKAGESCKDLLDNGYSTGDGTYWINPDGGDTSNALQAYCDMTTSGGGWTRVEYTADLPHQAQFTGTADANRWLNSNFTLTLSNTQINDIRAVSTEGKQTYRGTCDGVIHYNYAGGNYTYAFGFRFHQGDETAFNQQTYPTTNITVIQDGCETNNSSSLDTVFEIQDLRLPVINVHSRDNSNTELFGSPLTSNPAWLR